MESKFESTQPQFRSGICGTEAIGLGFSQFSNLIPPDTGGSSFTALLELSSPQAVELLVNDDVLPHPPIFPSDTALIDRASKFSVFALAENSPGSNSIPSGSSSMKIDTVKEEQLDSDSHLNSSSPAISNQSLKRKGRDKKVKESTKKSKKVLANEDGGETLPYVHVRARRGQATDSHSLAERARREKINARMKLLQELVPGCNKISGTAMVLEEIINHVQALQRQVEFLSMQLATVNPSGDFNFDAILAAQSEAAVDTSFPSLFGPSLWSDGQVCVSGAPPPHQQVWHFDGVHQPVWDSGREEHNFVTQENSLLSFDSSVNSASLHSSQLKMEL